MSSATTPQMETGTLNIDNRVKTVVSNIRNLPTPPIVFQQIQKVINDPSVSAGQIASILSEDPAMSAKVLKLTNSAFYGLSREIESVKQAVLIVGIEAVKNLVLSASVLEMFKGNIDQDYQNSFWRHSLATAFCSRMLVKNLKSQRMVESDPAFSAGLLHDVGKMILSCFLPKEYAEFRKMRVDDKIHTDYELELQLFGYTHAQIGGCLAAQWKLPSKLAEAIVQHHTPEQVGDSNPLPYFVNMANYLSKITFFHRDDRYLAGQLSPEVMSFLGVEENEIEGLCEMLKEEYVQAETFLQMAGIR